MDNNGNITDMSMETIALSSDSDNEYSFFKDSKDRFSILETSKYLNTGNDKNENNRQQYLQEAYAITESSVKLTSNHLMTSSNTLPVKTKSNCSINSQVMPDWTVKRCSSVFDDLLFEIYDRWHYGGHDIHDSDTLTDVTESDIVFTKMDTSESSSEHKKRSNSSNLIKKGKTELKQMVIDLTNHNYQMSSMLVKQLKRRDRYISVLREKYDLITAILQASSLKRREDSKIRFSSEPFPGEDGFNQWLDSMKAIIRLPNGIPVELRRKVWLSLADKYISSLCINWEMTKKFVFNEKTNPDDNKLGLQIVKDLHRTGCTSFNGSNSEEDRAVLKRVLLAFARWNKKVGYCQGFNIIAAFILDVVDRREDEALKIMIYLIEHILPESYFADNLRSLSVDMAVFRELLRSSCPRLSKHLDNLRTTARDKNTGTNYEPPLTNVFIMQWFLTLFATCLPKVTALRVWDSILIDGSEIQLKTAVVIWASFQKRILALESADEFYSSMEIFSHELLEGRKISADTLIRNIYNVTSYPLSQLNELREKLSYNITPFSATMIGSVNKRKINNKIMKGSDEINGAKHDEEEEEDEIENINCFAGLFPLSQQPASNCLKKDVTNSDMSQVSPGAYNAHPEMIDVASPLFSDRVSLDITMLRRQYVKLKQRQQQAHLILISARNRQNISEDQINMTSLFFNILGDSNNLAVNHLFMSRDLMKNYNGTAVPCNPTSPALQTISVHPMLTVPKLTSSIPYIKDCAQHSNVVSSGEDNTQLSDEDNTVYKNNITFPDTGIANENVVKIVNISLNGHDTDGTENLKCNYVDNNLKLADQQINHQFNDLLSKNSNQTCENIKHFTKINSIKCNNSCDTNIDLTVYNIAQACIIKESNNKSIMSNIFKKSNSNNSLHSIVESVYNFKHKNVNNLNIENIPNYEPFKKSDNDFANALNTILSKNTINSKNKFKDKLSNNCQSDNKIINCTNLSSEKVSKINSNESALQLKNFPHNKTYNHFSRQISCTRMMRKGFKLGLYSSDTINQFRHNKIMPIDNHDADIQHKTYHNACLHRQYLVSINQEKK